MLIYKYFINICTYIIKDRRETNWYKVRIRAGYVLTDKYIYIEDNIREGRIRSTSKEVVRFV